MGEFRRVRCAVFQVTMKDGEVEKIKKLGIWETNDRFMKALLFHFTRMDEAGKRTNVSSVCGHFSEVDRGAFSSSIDRFRQTFKGLTIDKVTAYGETYWTVTMVKKK